VDSPLLGAGNTLYTQLKSKWIHPAPRSGVVLVTEGISATVKKTLVNFEL
jgi:hypothetical protein